MNYYLFWLVALFGLPLNDGVNVSKRIIGGKPVTIEEYPYYVLVYLVNLGPCGGSLIAPNKVLTAAHCVDGKNLTDIVSYPGLVDMSKKDVTKPYKSKQFHLKPGYKFPYNDTAVIELTESVTVGPRIQTIKLSPNPPKIGDIVTIVGYGNYKCVKYGKGCLTLNPQRLQMAKMKVASVGGQLVMYINKKSDTDTCNGDSGGPVTINGMQYVVHNLGQLDCKGIAGGINVNDEEIKSFLGKFVTY